MPAKQEPSRNYKKARDVSQQPPSTRRRKKRIVLGKGWQIKHRRRIIISKESNCQPEDRRITVLPERTGELESQHEKRVNIASHPTGESQSRSTRQIGRITIAWTSTNNQSQSPRRFNSPTRKDQQITIAQPATRNTRRMPIATFARQMRNKRRSTIARQK